MKKTMQAFEDELLLYPRGKHDDLLDGFFYANKNAYRPSHDETTKEQQEQFNFYKSKVDWRLM